MAALSFSWSKVGYKINDFVTKHRLATSDSVADNVFSGLLSFVPCRVKGEVVNCESSCLIPGLLRLITACSYILNAYEIFSEWKIQIKQNLQAAPWQLFC
jgi:hypothetical protein